MTKFCLYSKNIVKDLEIGKDSGTASKLKILGGDETSEEVGVEKIAQGNNICRVV